MALAPETHRAFGRHRHLTAAAEQETRMAITDIVLIVVAALLLIIGIIGCIIPGLPGTPLCWAALLAGHFCSLCALSWPLLAVTGAACIAVEIIDNIIPAYFTKISGGTRAGSIGSVVGALAGVFSGQIVLIFVGPFFGALAGELIHDRTDAKRAFKSACFSFLGFMTGTGLRLITSGIFAVIFVRSFF